MFGNPFRFTAFVFVLLGCVLSLPATAVAQSGCVRFEGIDHCPFGDTTLQLAPDGSRLIVTGLGPQGNEGVASLFDTTSEWRAELSPAGKNPGDRVVFNAISEGSVAARATLSYQPDGSLDISTRFTGAAGSHTYTAYVMSEGQVVAGEDDLPEFPPIGVGPFPPWFPPERIPFPDTGFPQLSNGACVYHFSFDGQVTVTLPSGKQVVGDGLRLVEDVGAPGGYPYAGFQSMVIQANGDALEITREEIASP